MSGLFAVYRAQFVLSFSNWFAYRVGMIFWFLVRVVEPLIYISVWSSIAESNGGMVGGLTSGELAAYYIVLMVVNQVTFLGIIGLWGYRVRVGALSNYLLRPVSLLHRDLADMLANKSITLGFIVPAVIIMVLLFQPTLTLSLLNVVAFIVAVIIAFFTRFLLETVVGMAAFWVTRMDAGERLYSVILFFFSGRIAPLILLPDGMQSLANILPFRWILSFPVEIMMGTLTVEGIVYGFFAQGLWLLLLLICLPRVWRACLKRYTGVDG
jgi:ABC-2 type transport system permease protein